MLNVRAATAADAALLAEYLAGLYREDPGAHRLSAEQAETKAGTLLAVDAGNLRVLILQADGEAIGYALLVPYYSHEYGGLTVFLDEFYVQASRRSSGCGGQFLELLKTQAALDGFVWMFLEVRSGNIRAQSFYRRHGFAVTDDRLQMRCELAEESTPGHGKGKIAPVSSRGLS